MVASSGDGSVQVKRRQGDSGPRKVEDTEREGENASKCTVSSVSLVNYSKHIRVYKHSPRRTAGAY